ncbi:MAG: EamA family transporter, partial [Bacteroidetes bacterium]
MSRSLLSIHLAVLLFGLAGLFGKWIDLPAEGIVLGRTFFAGLFLLGWSRARGNSLRLPSRVDYLRLLFLGLVLAFHWVAFFRAIQLSTVAIGLLTFSSFPLFTTFLEPWVFREPLRARAVGLALLTLLGVALVIPPPKLSPMYFEGALWGLASGASFAVLSLLNRRFVRHFPGRTVAFYQNVGAFVALSPFLLLLEKAPGPSDWGRLILLGVVFTGLSHTLFIQGLREVKAQTASIITSLEPVYGLLAAWLLLAEVPG